MRAERQEGTTRARHVTLEEVHQMLDDLESGVSDDSSDLGLSSSEESDADRSCGDSGAGKDH